MSMEVRTNTVVICDFCSKEAGIPMPPSWSSQEVIKDWDENKEDEGRDYSSIQLHGCCKAHMALAILKFYNMDEWITAK